VTFDIATQDGTANVANNDYVARSLTSQTIPGGSQTYSFAVTVNTDTTIEPNETFSVNVTNVLGATVADGQGQGTILNDDSPVLSVADVSQNEGDSGPTTFTFTVTSSLPAPAAGITFDITTQDSTAVAPGDYTARSLTSQTIPAGQQTYNFDVTVNGDTLVELNETFLVKVTSANGNPQATGAIVNDDTANLVISQVYGGGNNSGAQFRNDFVEIFNRGTTTVDFSLTPYSVQHASVGSNFGSNKTNLTSGIIAPHRYFLVQESGGTTNGVALPSPDATGTIALASTSGKVALVAGTTSLSSTACPGDDGTSPFNPLSSTIADFVGYGDTSTTAGHCYEGSAPTANLSNTTSDFRKAGGCVDSNDNASDFFVAQPNPRNSASATGDCKPEIIINDVTVTEGNSGTVNASFTVSLTAASSQTVTVDFATADGSATAPADYQANGGTLTFNPGQTTKTIAVIVNGDLVDELDETFTVNIFNPTNATITTATGTGTITDDDAPPTVTLSLGGSPMAEAGGVATVTATLSAVSSLSVTVDLAFSGTATLSTDYTRSGTSIVIPPGSATGTITLIAVQDSLDEDDETILVDIANVTNGTESGTQQVTAIITDDDLSPTVSFTADSSSGLENVTPATIAVSLSTASGRTVTVGYSVNGGTATGGGIDYMLAGGTLTFSPGVTNQSITLSVVNDTADEIDETVPVTLSAPTNAALGAITTHTYIILDDDPLPSLAINDVTVTEGNNGTTNANFTVTLSPASGKTVTVSYATADGTGTAPADYAALPTSTLTFNPGETTKTITVLVNGDIVDEPNETFTINLTGASGATLAAQSAATVMIMDNDSTNGVDPIDDTSFFVRQQYIDFLGREPDPPGFAGWTSTINNCAPGDTSCDRIHVSQLFFQSEEFQSRGYFVYRFYPVAFGRKPDYAEFVPDLARVSGFLDPTQLEVAKVAFIADFMARAAFTSTYNGLTNQQYVDALLNTAGVTLAGRQSMIDGLNNSTLTRAVVLRQIVESAEVGTKYNHQAYAVMEYFGYLRRQPDAFYLAWIQVLDQSNDPRGMVTGFVTSTEYRQRFGPP